MRHLFYNSFHYVNYILRWVYAAGFMLAISFCFSLSCKAGIMTDRGLDELSLQLVDSGFVNPNATYKSSHASTLVDCGGSILAAWFGGSYEKHPDVCIYVASKEKGVWQRDRMVADGVETELIRNPCWNPVLFKRENGDIVLYYKVGPSPSKWYGAYKVSTDQGKSWSEEHRISGNLLGPIKNKPVSVPSGILYPTSIEDDQHWTVHMEFSNVDLSEWKKIEVDNGCFDAIQPTILTYPNNRLQILCRSKNQVITESWSEDMGRTWSEMQATSLPSNNSGIDAVTLSNGIQILIYNPIVEGRNKLSVAASIDGKTWKDLIILEDQPSGEFSYPAIIQGDDGKIYATYTYNREKIKYVVMEIK